MGADVTHSSRQAGCDLALHDKVPLLDIVSPWIRFHKRGGERTGPHWRLARGGRVRRPHLAECTVWIAGRSADQPGDWRLVGRNSARQVKRHHDALLGVKVSR